MSGSQSSSLRSRRPGGDAQGVGDRKAISVHRRRTLADCEQWVALVDGALCSRAPQRAVSTFEAA